MSRRSNTTIGLIAIAVITVGVLLAWTKSLPFRSHYEIKAAFETSNNIRPGSPVRIAGVEVGKVTGVERAGGNGAIVTMRIQDKGRPVHADATAKIRPRIFLEGNFFVDLTAGSPSADELDDGATLPVQQTATPVQLDEVLTALQSDTREDLKVLLREYGTRARGRGRARLQPLAPVLGARLPRLGDRRRRDAGRDRPRPLRLRRARRRHRQGARPQSRAAQVAGHRLPHHGGAPSRVQEGNLRAAVGELPNTLRASMPALDALNESFPPLRSLASELRPGVQSSEETLDVSLPFVRELRGLVSAGGAARTGRRPAADGARPRCPDRPQHPALPPGPPRRELPEHGHPPVVDGHGARRAVPGPGQGLRGGAQAAARPRRREPLG